MAGIGYKNFVKSTPATTWEIEHSPDLRAVMDVILANGTVVQPLSVIHTSNELVTITFNTAQAGRVRLLPWLPFAGEDIPLTALYGEDNTPLLLETGEYLEFDA